VAHPNTRKEAEKEPVVVLDYWEQHNPVAFQAAPPPLNVLAREQGIKREGLAKGYTISIIVCKVSESEIHHQITNFPAFTKGGKINRQGRPLGKAGAAAYHRRGGLAKPRSPCERMRLSGPGRRGNL
jgi:hypothetical protein